MPRRIDSDVQAGYVEPIEYEDEALGAVVGMLELTDEQQTEKARNLIIGRLEDLISRRSRTAQPESIRKDRADLNALAKLADSQRLSEGVSSVRDRLDELREKNPVLFRRLEETLGNGVLETRAAELERVDHFLAGFGQEIEGAVVRLLDEFSLEDGRGRPPEHADRAFASSLYQIWVAYTSRGTSRQNTPERARDPFGDFVDAAGKLVDPEFEGHYHARKVHEAARELAKESESGGK